MSNRSSEWFARARKKIPGGVNSPVRAWQAVGGEPRFIARGVGCRIVDVDGISYIDFVGSWGPLILGHAPADIVGAVGAALNDGTSFGAPTPREVELAEAVAERFPSIEKLRLVSSGTEATMSAIRVARAFTKRNRIVKFDGCYHGHVDALLARAGSGLASLALPDSAGVPAAFAAETAIAPYNDTAAVATLFANSPAAIAAVIVEPVCGNMGVIPPARGFLAFLREITRSHGALLIFDEVITGCRVARGGAQELFHIQPDLTCLGKILGGGLPLGAFGGRAEIMDMLAPEGPVYQAGTLSGNPLAVAAGLAMLGALARPGVYEELEGKGARLQRGLEAVLKSRGIQGVVNRQGSMVTLFFGVERVRDAEEARGADRERFGRFFHGMLERGVYWPPSQFEAAFVSLAHAAEEIDRAVAAFDEWAAQETKG
ncbi:MAG TPA: glutamate-1-semialdehyde 2,1-aminomutase [Verrucomicrobiae bacterium]|jgi:glutamate-1-semialdehyde 2,1-aminomutase|nr:glutamate-1-semialdehyde 2,1-aminomutase [Verrucomicrobiae bacterium]